MPVMLLPLLVLAGSMASTPNLTVIGKRTVTADLRFELVGLVTPSEYGGRSNKSDLRVWVEKRVNGSWRCVAADRVVGTDNGGDKVSFQAGDFDGDGRFEAGVCVQLHCAVRVCGTVWAYRWDGDRIQRLGTVDADEWAEIADLNHDGKWEARVVNDVGVGCHAALIRWPDHYAVRGNRLVKVNEAFPKTYKDILGDLLENLAENPWDDWVYCAYGDALRYAGIKESPRHFYREVVRRARVYMKAHPDGFDRNRFEEAINDLGEMAKRNAPFQRLTGPPYQD
jgi:hypothetical protein